MISSCARHGSVHKTMKYRIKEVYSNDDECTYFIIQKKFIFFWIQIKLETLFSEENIINNNYVYSKDLYLFGSLKEAKDAIFFYKNRNVEKYRGVLIRKSYSSCPCIISYYFPVIAVNPYTIHRIRECRFASRNINDVRKWIDMHYFKKAKKEKYIYE